LNLSNGDTFRLVAVTPIILEDDNGINKADVNLVLAALGADFEVLRCACAETTVSGYYGKWLLPKRQERALAEGSTIVFRYNGNGTMLDLNFIGKRTGEGFGQVRFESVPASDAFSFAPKAENIGKITKSMQEVETLRAAKNAVTAGIAFAESNYEITREKDNAPKGANLSRILAALGQAADFVEFAEKLIAIKQSNQLIAALVFATGKDKGDFRTDPKHLEPRRIARLLEEKQYYGKTHADYETYKKHLTAAAQRIKQKRRSIDKPRR
jgi:hypothetical protein